MIESAHSRHAGVFAADAAAIPASRPLRRDDEHLPFLSSFHDIFTTIGVVILFVGLAVASGQIAQAIGAAPETLASELVVVGLLVVIAAAAFALSALLVGRQRRILPGIILCLIVVGCAATALIWAYARLTFGIADPETIGAVFERLVDMEEPTRAAMGAAVNDLPLAVRAFPVGVGLIVSALIWFYYISFRLPFAMGLLGLAAVTTATVLVGIIDPYSLLVWNPLISLAGGLALFVAGIAFDARDPLRQTRFSGAGFWLHVFAAPALLGAAVTIANSGLRVDLDEFGSNAGFGLGRLLAGDSDAAVRNAAVTLAVIGVFAIISLLINRRALIVAGLVTAGVAIAVLVSQSGFGQAAVIAVTLLALGGVVVLLGAAWTPVRRILTAPFPKTGFMARIIPPAGDLSEG